MNNGIFLGTCGIGRVDRAIPVIVNGIIYTALDRFRGPFSEDEVEEWVTDNICCVFGGSMIHRIAQWVVDNGLDTTGMVTVRMAEVGILECGERYVPLALTAILTVVTNPDVAMSKLV